LDLFIFGLMLDLNARLNNLINFKNYFVGGEKVITGLVAGLAAGAILRILFTPDKGTETRKKISENGTDFKDNTKIKFSSMVDDVVDKYENMKGKQEI
jgi:gas vesicle protein